VSDMLGADPVALESLAAAMGSAARRLDHIRAITRAQLHSVQWHGADADSVRSEWDGRHSLVLASAAQSLSAAQARLVHEAQQQIEASGTGSGAGSVPAPGWLARVKSAWDARSGYAKPAFDFANGAFGLLGAAAVLVAKSSTTGRYSRAWTDAVTRFGPLARYKTSPFLNAISGSPTLAFLKRLDDMKLVKSLGKTVSVVGKVVDFGGGAIDLTKGHYASAADHFVDGGASILKGSKNPVGYLVGVNVSLWKEVVKEASHQKLADWTTPLPNPFNGTAWRDVYVPAGRDVIAQNAVLLPKILL
jgi:hypothetical protein